MNFYFNIYMMKKYFSIAIKFFGVLCIILFIIKYFWIYPKNIQFIDIVFYASSTIVVSILLLKYLRE